MSHTTFAPERQKPRAQPTTVTDRAGMDMAAHARCVRTTRRFTTAVLARWGIHGEESEAAVLIVSELATNAVQHGRTELTLTLALFDDTLRIEVTDYGTRPTPPDPFGALPDEHGRGLGIVSCLATRTETWLEDWGRRVTVALTVQLP